MRKNVITSASNTKVKRVQQLNAKAKARREEQCFVAEGRKLFTETPAALRDHVFVTEQFEQEHENLLANVDYDVVEAALFKKMSDTQTPQGIITVAKMPSYEMDQLLGNGSGANHTDASGADENDADEIRKSSSDLAAEQSKKPLLLVLEDLQDPGNVGTMIRTAEGAGVTGILMSAKTADPFQPKVIRSTMGSIFRVPIVRTDSLAEQLQWLKAQGVKTYAAHLQGQNTYAQENYREGTAFLIGNEGNGLSDEISALADCRIRIPMEGKVESLNAAVAAALCMYAAHEQRFEA